ncbi:MAG: Omp28-related outer membrane protein [Candidatus Zixiibacteriota bacterium]
MEYHWVDAFSNADGDGRINYYNISGSPTAKFDGRRTVVGGWDGVFGAYLNAYNMEINFYPSRCTLNIFVDYDSTTRNLKVKARVTALDTISDINLRYAVAESHIYHPWQWLDSLHHVVRKMLPNYVGVDMPDMDSNDTFVDSQTYTLPPAGAPPSGVNDKNVYVVVFVQNNYGNHPVYRSAKSGLFPTWVFGDATADGTVDGADVVYLLNYLFVNGPPPNPLASGDPNYDCAVNAADVVYLMNYLYVNGPEPQKGCAF